MSHLSELQLSMYVDDALLADERVQIESHLNGCDACQGRLEAMRHERHMRRELRHG